MDRGSARMSIRPLLFVSHRQKKLQILRAKTAGCKRHAYKTATLCKSSECAQWALQWSQVPIKFQSFNSRSSSWVWKFCVVCLWDEWLIEIIVFLLICTHRGTLKLNYFNIVAEEHLTFYSTKTCKLSDAAIQWLNQTLGVLD